tara:strand:+ start:163 stop:462 length:300 start_codon:yes stop_codon:yes gene_type:complete
MYGARTFVLDNYHAAYVASVAGALHRRGLLAFSKIYLKKAVKIESGEVTPSDRQTAERALEWATCDYPETRCAQVHREILNLRVAVDGHSEECGLSAFQ